MQNSIEDRIKQAREKKGISQEELGSLIGVSSRTIVNYEKNANKISIEKLKKISKECEVSVQWLVNGIEFKNEENNITNGVQVNGHNSGTININSNKEMSHAICEEIKKLPTKRIEYFYHTIKAESLKENT